MREIIPMREVRTYPLSKLLRLALEDAKELINQGVALNMDDWVSTNIMGEVCSVCLGGAAILGRLPPMKHIPQMGICDHLTSLIRENEEPLWQDDWQDSTILRMQSALDSLRSSLVTQAINTWYHDAAKVQKWREFEPNYTSRKIFQGLIRLPDLPGFFTEMEALADKLEKLGL